MKKFIAPMILFAAGAVLFGWSFASESTSGELDIDIVKTKTIMPAAHNVYANPDALNGKYYLFKAKITNNTNKKLEDVTVKYRVPGYIEWTELSIIGEMFPGQTASVRCYPKFKDDITQKMTESVEKAEIEISWDGAKEDDVIEEEFAFKISNRNEYMFTNIPAEEIAGWGDVYDNNALLACFVTPNDPIVKYYTQNIQEKILKGEAASVNKDPNEAVRFLVGIYEATRLSHMVYSGTKGIPESTQDISQFSQHNRLPREVITGNTGLCLELSLLYTSILSNAGLDPIIFLVPGHAYPGFKLNGLYYAIEATGIGGEGLGGIASAEEAFNAGQKELDEFIQKAQYGDPRYTIVDIHELNKEGVTPMLLNDDDFLRNKVDDMVGAWGTATEKNEPAKRSTKKRKSSSDIEIPNNEPRANALSFAIPNGWQTIMKPLPQVPIITAQVISPDQSTTVTIYDIPVSNVQQAMNTIGDYMYAYGMTIEYQANGNNLSGITYSSNGNFAWIGKSIRTQNGMRIVAVGSPDYLYNQNTAAINQVYNSIR